MSCESYELKRDTLRRLRREFIMPPDSEKINPDFLIMQYEQAMETFRHGVTSLAQLVTVFVLADITLIGFAIDNQIAGIISWKLL